MNIITKLTWKQLKQNKKRTRITLISIILSLTMIITITHLIFSSGDAYRSLIIDTHGNYHISFSNVSDLQISELENEENIETYYIKDGAEGLPTIYIRLKNIDKTYEKKAYDIAQKYNLPLSDGTQNELEITPGDSVVLDFNRDLLASEGVIFNDRLAFAVTFFGGIFILIVAFASILVINNSFQISSDERTQQFGVLKSAGGTNKQIRKSVFSEGVILSAISIPIGIVTGLFMQWIVINIFDILLPYNIQFRFIIAPIALLLSVLITLSIVMISAYMPARKASKTSPIDSIKMTKTIKVNPKHVRTSGISQKLFGIEGMLATKTFKRNRSKNRSAILSLVVGIVLFIGVSSFGQYMSHISQMVYPEYGSDVMIMFNKVEHDKFSEIKRELSNIPDSKITTVKQYQTLLTDNDIHYSNELKDNFASDIDLTQNDNNVVLFSLDELRFNEISGQTVSDDISTSQIKGILINRATSRSIDIKPFDVDTGIILKLDDTAIRKELVLSKIIDTIPPEISMLIQTSDVTAKKIIVSESDMKFIEESSSTVSSYLLVHTDNPKNFTSKTEQILSNQFGLTNENYVIVDYSAIASMNRNIIFLVNLLVYGFIGLLTLIAVTSVINTIATNLELRKKEYAMLMSTGMTIQSRNRMVIFENLQYGIKSLIVGCPVGLALSYLLYFALQQYFSFQYAFPWISILISFVVVIIIMLLMGRYSINKLKNVNIIETLKSQIV